MADTTTDSLFFTPLIVANIAAYLEQRDRRSLYETSKQFSTIHNQKQFSISICDSYYISLAQRLRALLKLMPNLEDLHLRFVYANTKPPSAEVLELLSRVPRVHLYLQDYADQRFQSWYKVNWPFQLASVYVDSTRFLKLTKVGRRKIVKIIGYMRPKEFIAEDAHLLMATEAPKKILITNEMRTYDNIDVQDLSILRPMLDAIWKTNASTGKTPWTHWVMLNSQYMWDIPPLFPTVDYMGIVAQGITQRRWESLTEGISLRTKCPQLKSVHLVYNYCNGVVSYEHGGVPCLMKPMIWEGDDERYLSPLQMILDNLALPRDEAESSLSPLTLYVYSPSNMTLEGWQSLVATAPTHAKLGVRVVFVCLNEMDAKLVGYFNRRCGKSYRLCTIHDPELEMIHHTYFYKLAVNSPLLNLDALANASLPMPSPKPNKPDYAKMIDLACQSSAMAR
jgi:hypothetical protein